ncbi:MAG TPA: hypothetical protein VNH11_31055 [Pirellulales bacterium]|nr:hypothetical protein [Pirellulales bacterium]HVA50823.1 hypothetical protein [Pirellulales bacterium]
MLQSITSTPSISPAATQSSPQTAALQAASSQAIQDSLKISSQGQAASAALDSDGDHDGS